MTFLLPPDIKGLMIDSVLSTSLLLVLPGANLKIMGIVQKLLERALAHEKLLNKQLTINKFEKTNTFFRKK